MLSGGGGGALLVGDGAAEVVVDGFAETELDLSGLKLGTLFNVSPVRTTHTAPGPPPKAVSLYK